MMERRAKHSLTQMQDPMDSFNKLLIALGGITFTYHTNLQKKKKTQSMKEKDFGVQFKISLSPNVY